VFEAALTRFQRVSVGGGVPLEKNTRLAGSESNHRTAKAKIFRGMDLAASNHDRPKRE